MSAPCLHCSGQVTPVGSPTAQPRPARWRGPCASVHRAPASTRRALRSWPPAGARPREQLPHGQRGALPAEVRQGPLPVPLNAAGTLFSQTGGRPGWVAGVLPAPGSSGQTPVEEPAGHTPGPDPRPRTPTSFKPLQALVKTSLPLHQHLVGTSMDKDACCQKGILIKCLRFSARNELT